MKLRRIQVAFTEIAHAYETLEDRRIAAKIITLRFGKELEYREKLRAAGQALKKRPPEDRQAEHGTRQFRTSNGRDQRGRIRGGGRPFGWLPSITAHKNALYHAYFGYALWHLEKQHHKAEASLQQAVKLDPKNPKIRMMLVEFFMEMKMAKRAEGELRRFLELCQVTRKRRRCLRGFRRRPDRV